MSETTTPLAFWQHSPNATREEQRDTSQRLAWVRTGVLDGIFAKSEVIQGFTKGFLVLANPMAGELFVSHDGTKTEIIEVGLRKTAF